MREATLKSATMSYDSGEPDWKQVYTGFILDEDIKNLTYSFSNKFEVVDNPLEYGLKHTQLPGPFLKGLTNKIGTMFEIANATIATVQSVTDFVSENKHKYYVTDQNGGVNSLIMKNGRGFTIYQLFTRGPGEKVFSTEHMSETLSAFSLIATGNDENNETAKNAKIKNPGPTALQWSSAMVLGAKDVSGDLSVLADHVSDAFNVPTTPFDTSPKFLGKLLAKIGIGQKNYQEYYSENGDGYKALEHIYQSLYEIESKLADAVLKEFPGRMYKLNIEGVGDIGPFIVENVSMSIDFSNISSDGIPLKSGIAIKQYKMLSLKDK